MIVTDKQDLAARLDDLEVRFAFQEEAIESLSDIASRQWKEIDRLQKALGLLGDRVAELEEGEDGVPVDRPPHY
nr:SlyX family protein [Kordiimonas marina]